MTSRDAIGRRAARIILTDAGDRVLLLHGIDPGRPGHGYWFTAGGGLDVGETPAQGAARELHEETGLAVAPETLGVPVWREVVEFPFDGQWYRQEQEFFHLRVQSWEVVAVQLSAEEARSLVGHRWWSLAELRTTTERYYPAELPELVERLVLPC